MENLGKLSLDDIEQLKITLGNYNKETPPLNVFAVVKIFSTAQKPDYSIPWQTSDILIATGSGAVIGDNLILTAAHVISSATYIQIQKISEPNKCSARVVNVCHDSDLALLESTDPNFLAGITPIEVGALPKLRDRVNVCGFPVGGEELSITEGIVSRIEVQVYSHSRKALLAAQVDAAINSGNSGGPVLSREGKLIGIAFQSLSSAENTGYMVPFPIINHFLEGNKRFGRNYQAFPDLGISVEVMQNPILRKRVKMQEQHSGVLVTKVFAKNSAWGHLKEGDVILEIDGYSVENNGTIKYYHGIRMDATVLVMEHFVGDMISMKILRDGGEQTISFPLKPLKDLIPLFKFDVHPRYFIYCGLVFQPVSLDLLHALYTSNWYSRAPSELAYLFDESGKRRLEFIDEVVVLSMVLVNDLNISYDDFVGGVIEEVNGEAVVSLADLAEKVERIVNNPECRIIEFKTSKNYRLVLPTLHVEDCQKVHEATLTRYRVPQEKQIVLDLPLHQYPETIPNIESSIDFDAVAQVISEITDDSTIIAIN
jgi:S1-C subfamily serine protease